MEKIALVVAIVVLAIAERVPFLRRESAPFLRPAFVTDLIYLVTGATLLGVVLRDAVAALAARHPVAQTMLDALPFAAIVLAAVVLYDLGGWLTHRWLHASAVLWRFHQVHHSSPRLDWLATFRAHLVEHALRHATSGVSLLLIGFPPQAVALAAGTYGIWAMLNHANLDLHVGALEGVLITPRLHRSHHVPATTERNFGTILALWDRWAGTLDLAAAGSPAALGVPERPDFPQTWRAQLLEPLRPAGSRRAAVAIPPAVPTATAAWAVNPRKQK